MVICRGFLHNLCLYKLLSLQAFYSSAIEKTVKNASASILFLPFQYVIADHGGVIMLGFNENSLINNKSCKEITEIGKVACPTFQMKERRNKYG